MSALEEAMRDRLQGFAVAANIIGKTLKAWEENESELAALRLSLAASQAECARLRGALRNAKRGHYYCDDHWFSCPLHSEGCANDDLPKECNCGADEHNAAIDALLATPSPEDALRAMLGRAWDAGWDAGNSGNREELDNERRIDVDRVMMGGRDA